MSRKLEDQILLAYETAKSLEEPNEDAEDMKRAIIDDLRSALDNLTTYNESLHMFTVVDVRVEASVMVYVKHRPDQDASEAAIRFVDSELSIHCENCNTDIDLVDSVKQTIIKNTSCGEDVDITDEEL